MTQTSFTRSRCTEGGLKFKNSAPGPSGPQPGSIKLYCDGDDGIAIYQLSNSYSRERLCNNNRGQHSYLLTFPKFGN